MSYFTLSPYQDNPLSYRVNGLAVSDATLSATEEGWVFSFSDAGAERTERRFDSMITALSFMGVQFETRFDSGNYHASQIINTLIENLFHYVKKKSPTKPGTTEPKLTRELRADLEEANNKMSLVLGENERGIHAFCFRVKEKGEAEEKYYPLNILGVLNNRWQALIEEARRALDTKKSILGHLKPLPSMREKLRVALNQTKGKSDKIRDLFYDEALLGLIDEPVFCTSIQDRLAIYDQSSIDGMLKTNDEYRRVVEGIEQDDTGIAVILDNPNQDELNELQKVLNPLFKAWLADYPFPEDVDPDEELDPLEGRFLEFPAGSEVLPGVRTDVTIRIPLNQLPPILRQRINLAEPRDAKLHERLLVQIGDKLSHAVVEGLPKNVVNLISARQTQAQDLDEIEAMLLSLTEEAKQGVKDYLLALMIQAEGEDWVKPLQSLSDIELDNLMGQLLSIQYKLDEPPYFQQRTNTMHPFIPLLLNYHRNLVFSQMALKEDYRGRLQAIYDETGKELFGDEVRFYHPYEMKDFVGRRTINIHENRDARWFQSILIGGMYLAHEEDTHVIAPDVTSFVEGKLYEDELYLKKAKEAYINYMTGICDYHLPTRLKECLASEFSIAPRDYVRPVNAQAPHLLSFLRRGLGTVITEPPQDSSQRDNPEEALDSGCSLM